MAPELTFVRDPTWVKIGLTNIDVHIVVGPQNCGKSTLVKYLLNRLRSEANSDELYVLDADCGQPTFNLPGTISLHKFDQKSASSVLPQLSIIR